MPNTAFVTLYPTEMSRLLRAPGSPVGRYINLYSREIAAEAQALALSRLNVRTRRYAKGFQVKVERGDPGEGYKFIVSNNVKGINPRRAVSYAAVNEKGSRPHVIRPRKRDGMLVFYIGGRKIVTKQVNHPGTKPQHILRDAEIAVRKRRL